MNCELHYGEHQLLQLNFSSETEVVDFSATPVGEPLTDVSAAVSEVLAQPLNFPPLRESVFPGDQLVVALAPETPAGAEVVAATLRALTEIGVEPADITLLCAGAGSGRSSGEENAEPLVAVASNLLPPELRGRVAVVIHDPDDIGARAYLAASKKDAHPIYVNRRLVDADFVIPIGAVRVAGRLADLGPFCGLFPTFSDTETQRRFRVCDASNWEAHQRRCREQVDEAAWLLGTQFAIHVVPGAGDSAARVLAGERVDVSRTGGEFAAKIWRRTVPARVKLVVAAIEGGAEQQTWENFARALHVATRAVDDEGTIVLATNLRCPPGPLLKRMGDWSIGDVLPKPVRRERTPDTLAAAMVAEARERARVFLLSGLKDEVVEDLGIGCVASGPEIERLAKQCDSCLLLGNAQHAVVSVEEES